MSDSFSYSETGTRWVNIPWLFQWSHAAIFRLVRDLVPPDPADQTANQASAEQLAIGVLIGINALVRLITAWILLKIRRPGPGLWWSAVCVALALGAVVGPARILPGGIAGPGIVAPSTWGMLLLAIEMLLLHRAYNEGRRGALYGLVPLFLVWVNLDDSFFVGLLILAAAAVGRVLDGKSAVTLYDVPRARSRMTGRMNRNPGPDQASQRGRRASGAGTLRCGLPCQPLDLSRFPDLDRTPVVAFWAQDRGFPIQ